MAETAEFEKRELHKGLLAGAAVISFVMVLNDNVRRYGELLTPGLIATVAKFFLFGSVLYFSLFFLLKTAKEDALPAPEKETEKKRFLRYALLFFAVYLVYLLIFYPGVMYWDTMRQINDFFDGYTTTKYFAVYDQEITALLNDHDGVFDTILFGLFISIGNLFHSPNFGMFLYCLIQAFLFSLLFARIVLIIRQSGCPRFLQIGSVLFYLHPFVCFYAMMMLKDVIFALCFLPYFMVFARIANGGGDVKKNRVRLIVFSLLCAFTKKPGVYIVAISNLILLAAVWIRRKKEKDASGKAGIRALAVSVLLPAFLLLWLLPKVVYPAFSIYPGGKEEALAVCLQSTCLLVKEQEDSLTEEEKEIINRVLQYDRLADSFQSHTTDWAKYYFRSDATPEDLTAYMRFWVRKGLQQPMTYLRAVMAANGGFFSPTEKLEIYISANALTPETDYPGIGNLPATLSLREDIVRMYHALSDVPPFDFFFQNVLYAWIIPVSTTVLLLAQGRKKELPVLAPVLLSILVLIAGPESTTRFATHIIFLAPLFTALAIRKPFTEPRILTEV